MPLIDARTGRDKGGGASITTYVGAYGRDVLNDNRELLLSFANNLDLALVNTFVVRCGVYCTRMTPA